MKAYRGGRWDTGLTTISARMRAPILFVVAAGALLLAVAGPASAFDPTAVLAGANALRAQVGVRPLVDGSGSGAVTGDLWLVETDGTATATEVMAAWPKLLAWLLDPRTTQAVLAERAGGTVALQLVTNDTVPLVRPIVPALLDPGSPLGISLLLPARPGSVRLLETRGALEFELPVKTVRAAGSTGAWLAQLDGGSEGLRIAYSTRYRLVVDGVSYSYATGSLPSTFLGRSWQFDATMRSADRSAFVRALATAPPLARRLLAQLDGGVKVSRGACDDAESSCAEYLEDGSYRLSIAPVDFADTFADLRFVTLHELGHIVDYVGLDASAYPAFRALFRTSPHWRSCFPDDLSDTGCVEFSELLADQFAYWATGLPADPSGGYGDPPLASQAAFEQVLRAHYAFRPPLWRNPAAARR